MCLSIQSKNNNAWAKKEEKNNFFISQIHYGSQIQIFHLCWCYWLCVYVLVFISMDSMHFLCSQLDHIIFGFYFFHYPALIISFSSLSLSSSLHIYLSITPRFTSTPARFISHFVFDLIFNHFSSKQQQQLLGARAHTSISGLVIIISHFKLTVISI